METMLVKILGLTVALVCMALTFSPARPGAYQTDRGTTGFLRYNLVSGGEFTFPPEAVRQNLSGSGFFLMRLRPDGVVESVTIKMSSGYAVIDDHIVRTLKAYRFRPGTKQQIEWRVGFIEQATV